MNASTRRRGLLLASVMLTAFVAVACSGSDNTRQVLVDFNNPSYAAVFIAYFPTSVTVHPGMTVHFKQAWNGEPHTVTMGTWVDDAVKVINPLLPELSGPGPTPPDAQAALQKAGKLLPPMINQNNQVIQAAAQPCFLDRGTLVHNPNTTCPRRSQPAFNGRQNYYNSGFIAYTGNNGNSYDVKLASDIKPGTYHWYCNYHGPFMQGSIVVKPPSAPIPSQASIDREALRLAEARAKPVGDAIRQATTGPWDIFRAIQIAKFDPPPTDNQKAKLPGAFLAGYTTQAPDTPLANEFLPHTIHTKVGQKLTWAFIGDHTVSFDVPRYFPTLTIDANGTVRQDPRVQSGAGPKFPKEYPDNASDTFILDGGTWNGKGFYSSGLSPNTGNSNNVVAYSLTISRPGTYQYACLIHPRMVGTVVVST